MLFSGMILRAQLAFVPRGGECETKQYQEFTTCYSERHEQPTWVAYTLTKAEVFLPSQSRISTFITDQSISSGSSTHGDYTNTGYDRGHISRAMYNKVSRSAYRESYLMSNISPQIGVNFNRTGGDWYTLEDLEIDIAVGLGEVDAVSGPIFIQNLEVIGETCAITVPGYFYKALINKDRTQAVGFILRHDAVDLPSIWQAAVSIDSLEGFAGLDFFAGLDNKIEKGIESTFDLDFWKEQALNGKDLINENE